MREIYKLFFKFVNNCVLPRYQRRHEATYMDLAVMEVLDQNKPLNLPSMMIKHMSMMADPLKEAHACLMGSCSMWCLKTARFM